VTLSPKSAAFLGLTGLVREFRALVLPRDASRDRSLSASNSQSPRSLGSLEPNRTEFVVGHNSARFIHRVLPCELHQARLAIPLRRNYRPTSELSYLSRIRVTIRGSSSRRQRRAFHCRAEKGEMKAPMSGAARKGGGGKWGGREEKGRRRSVKVLAILSASPPSPASRAAGVSRYGDMIFVRDGRVKD